MLSIYPIGRDRWKTTISPSVGAFLGMGKASDGRSPARTQNHKKVLVGYYLLIYMLLSVGLEYSKWYRVLRSVFSNYIASWRYRCTVKAFIKPHVKS